MAEPTTRSGRGASARSAGGPPAPLHRRGFLELFALAGGSAVAGGQAGCDRLEAGPPVEGGTRGGGLSHAGLQRIHDRMVGYVERGLLPGMVTLVSRRGELHVDAIGSKGIGGAPMGRSTIFRIASMSKPITAAATMMLVEEGRLDLDEPVDRLLPELASRRVLRRLEGPLDDTVPAARPILVRDLLTFTMGFGFLFPFDMHPVQRAAIELKLGYGMPDPGGVVEPDEWMRRFGSLPLMSQPGEQWLYHTGSDVLGVLIARAAGQPFPVFLAERLLVPLGMKDTAFSVPPEHLDRLAVAYFANPETGALEPFDAADSTSQWSRPPAFPSGGGGLVSTVDDYLAFANLLLAGGLHGKRRLLSERSVAEMTSDQLTPAQKAVSGFTPGYFATRGWGYGLSMVTAPDEVSPEPGRYGWTGGAGTHWISDPAKDLVAILLTQRSIDPLGPQDEFFKLVYQALDD
jgi:CubicO group peptidase (beta-lactamase class C family)